MLEEFDEINSQISVEGHSLRRVDLAHQHITDEQISDLKDSLLNNNSVTDVDLRSNDISSIGAAYIADIIRHNKTITDLNIGSNKIGDEGALLIAEALEENTTLLKLNIGANHLTSVGIKRLSEALSNNSTLTGIFCGFNNVVTDRRKNAEATAHLMLSDLRENTTLTTINIGIGSGSNTRQVVQIAERNASLIRIPSPIMQVREEEPVVRIVENSDLQSSL